MKKNTAYVSKQLVIICKIYTLPCFCVCCSIQRIDFQRLFVLLIQWFCVYLQKDAEIIQCMTFLYGVLDSCRP